MTFEWQDAFPHTFFVPSAKTQADLERTCNKIANKPAPKVEPPKEEPAPAETPAGDEAPTEGEAPNAEGAAAPDVSLFGRWSGIVTEMSCFLQGVCASECRG